MNVSLTPELEKFVQDKVASGMYNSTSEVISEALSLLQEREMLKKLKIEDLQNEILKGIESGESKPLNIEDIIERGKQRLTQRKPD